MFGGTISIALQKRFGLSLINARRGAFTVGAIMMIGVAFVGFVDSPYVAIALLSLAGFAHQTLSVTVITMSRDLFRRNEVATVAGMAGTCGNAGLLIFSLLIGGLVTTVGYTPFFVGLAALDLIGAAVLWTLVREPARRRHRPSPGRRPSRQHVNGHGDHPQPDPSRLQSRSVDRPCRRRLLHRDLDLRVVSRASRFTTPAISCTGACSRARSAARASSTCAAIPTPAASGRRA